MAIINGFPPFVVGTDDADLITYNAGLGFAWLEGLGGNDRYEIINLNWMNDLAIVEQLGGGIDTVVVSGYSNSFISLDGLGLDTNPNTLENLIFAGFEGAGLVLGNALNNHVVVDGVGDNTINGGAGVDTMDGAQGNNQYVVDNSADVVLEDAGNGFDRVFASATYVLPANVEFLQLVDGEGVTLNLNGTGNALANDIFGNNGNNLLSGLGGDDDLNGNHGNDTLLGGEGNDAIEGGDGNDSLNGGVGHDLVWGDDPFDVGAEGNDILIGDTGDDSLMGQGGNDKLDGGLGNDYMRGHDGVDSLLGGAGDDNLDGGEGDGVVDSLDGGAGNDRFYIGFGTIDTVSDSAGGDDIVVSQSSYTLPTGIESLYLEGEAGTGTGNAGNNFIQGTSDSNILFGLAGNDVLDGRQGADTMNGGMGNDRFIVDNGDDVVQEASGLGSGTDVVFASVAF